MEYLLDTHTFIWFCEDDKNLSVKAKKIIEDDSNKVYLSIASLWEIAIKMQLQKLRLNKSIEEVIENSFENGFQLLPISPEHIVKLTFLDFHHRDPFDRILIAQSLKENIAIIGKDEAFDYYPIKRIWL